MKLIVFGATGKIGRHLAAQAISQNYQVSAFTRSPEKFGPADKSLQVIAGDVLDPAAVTNAVRGHDGVLCALGMPLMNKEKLRAKGTGNVIRAMQETGVKRLICLSVLGAGSSRNTLPFHYKYLIIPLFMRHTYADHELQESHVRNSALDWTIVRPGSFTDGSRTDTYRHGFTAADSAPTLKISATDVAHFMLKQLAGDTYLHQSPGLSN